jgi:hypothetical protein
VGQGAQAGTRRYDDRRRRLSQRLLFNEAEVLAAIEAADEAHRQRTTKVDAHERKCSPDSGRKAIPEHFTRIEIEHVLAPELKMCTLVRSASSADPHRTRDPRVLSLRAAEDQRRAVYALSRKSR